MTEGARAGFLFRVAITLADVVLLEIRNLLETRKGFATSSLDRTTPLKEADQKARHQMALPKRSHQIATTHRQGLPGNGWMSPLPSPQLPKQI